MWPGDVEHLHAVVRDDHDASGVGDVHASIVATRRRGVNDTYRTISATRVWRTPCVTARAGRYRALVDVRIGITQATRELMVEMPDDERDETIKIVEAALAGDVDVLWLTDKRGRQVGVPAAKLAYVEVGTNDGDRRIGFGG